MLFSVTSRALTPLIYHHEESQKMCRPTYPQGVTLIIESPHELPFSRKKHCFSIS